MRQSTKMGTIEQNLFLILELFSGRVIGDAWVVRTGLDFPSEHSKRTWKRVFLTARTYSYFTYDKALVLPYLVMV